ncbi:MAG: prenyltransferase [Bacteroidota bacterium]
MTDNSYASDIQKVLDHRFDQGADLWTTPDKRLVKGGVFSTLGSAMILTELGQTGTALMKETAGLILGTWRDDGRFRLSPGGAIYPCHTAGAARVLCRLGYADDDRLKRTFQHLLDIQHDDGGWKCSTYKFGRGPETVFSNPGTTLEALDAFRYTPLLHSEPRLRPAVEFLLAHWDTRIPLGPCHYGMGSLFMKVEFPFFRYNLFYYVYTLSFYETARSDRRFLEALDLLRSRMKEGRIIVENPNRQLEAFSFCRKMEASDLATARYAEIIKNLE